MTRMRPPLNDTTLSIPPRQRLPTWMRHLLTAFTICVGVMWMHADAHATPRMSLSAGTPCSACHINAAGGGGRTEIGWGSMAYVGALTYDQIGLDALHNLESNSVADYTVALGADIRVQVARLGRPRTQTQADGTISTNLPDRRIFPMQIQPYVGWLATDWLTLYGTYAIGQSTFQGEVCDPIYPGSSCYAALAKIQPSYDAPFFRVGHFRPSIGIRQDDHTMLTLTNAATPRQPLLAPNYAETGVEMSYQPTYWFRTDVGGFRARNISAAIGDPEVVGPNDAAALGKITFMPRIDALNMTTWLGSSLFWANKFGLESYFVGLGLMGKGSLMFEVNRSRRLNDLDYRTLNMMTILHVQAFDWLVPYVRVGQATTQQSPNEEIQTRQLVVGTEFFPVPYFEIRPEYRIIQTEDYILGQYALQLHTFF